MFKYKSKIPFFIELLSVLLVCSYFMKIDNARFKQKVVPGDTLIFKLELLSPFRRGLCHMKGTAYIGDKVVTEAELLAQVAKNKS